MKNGTYYLKDVLRDVAMQVKASGDLSATTIRCAINDHLDQWDRAGFRVRFDYNQPKAIKRVKEIAKTL